jgi:hypothetical protein
MVMHALHIALQEGFAHDDIAVSLDGAQVYRGQDISTRQQIGLAAAFDVNADVGSHSIEVRLPRRNDLSHLQALSVSGDTWLGISLRPTGQFDIRVSASPFGYL